jgi:hypothetical protein
MEIKDIHLASLHRYFIWANRLREHFDHTVEVTKASEASIELMWADDHGLFMAHWYGALYVVIEGWKELGLKDPIVDKLLDSPNVELLKRFRNGSFHFQKEYFDSRFANFWYDSKNTVPWVRQLNSAFGRFFLKEMSSKTSLNTQIE